MGVFSNLSPLPKPTETQENSKQAPEKEAGAKDCFSFLNRKVLLKALSFQGNFSLGGGGVG